ncbi:MAG: CPBP family intramembrane metalloprotease [Microbacteriaceae bacterium]|nr:CPBP family intramembrane metalloprotease [Microbacteriaceae bacterium]
MARIDDLVSFDLAAWRDVIFGPIAEEFVFRSCMCSLLLAAGWSPTATVLISPLFFGTAHLHHLMIHPAIQVIGQFGYTTLFGWIVAFYFVQTRSLFAPAIAHIFCNFVGLPEVALVVRAHGARRAFLISAYVIGLISFFLTIGPLIGLVGAHST